MTKNSDKVLKIKTATLDDAGTIVCKGVNGFGKAQVNIELIVLGNELFLPYLYKGATTFCPSFILSTFLNKILVHKNKDLSRCAYRVSKSAINILGGFYEKIFRP